MMILFITVIWGGLAVALIHLQKHPDETAGYLGNSPHSTDEILSKQEIREM